MRLKIDKDADALYLRLDNSTIAETEEVSPGIVLDYNGAGKSWEWKCYTFPPARPKSSFPCCNSKQHESNGSTATSATVQRDRIGCPSASG